MMDVFKYRSWSRKPKTDSNYDRLSAAGTLKSLRRNSPSVVRLERDMPENSGSQHLSTTSRIANFFAKRSFRAANPMKRTKSATKLDRKSINGIDQLDSLEGLPKKTFLTPPHLQCNSRVTRSHESIVAAIRSAEMPPNDRAAPGGIRYFGVDDEWKYYDFSKADEKAQIQPQGPKSHRCLMEANASTATFPRRTDHVLKLWLQEAKGLPAKKRYYCEVYLDQTLYARTSAKAKQELLFWGEQFEFAKLPVIQTLEVHLYRESEKKRKKEKSTLIGKVIAPISAVSGGQMTERWYPVILEKNSGVKSDDAAIRIKARHQAIHILPLEKYQDLIEYIKTDYIELCRFLEPRIGIKAKEEIATAMVNIMHELGLSSVFLVDIVMEELNNLDDCHLTFRGNTLATKAMEAFMKLAGNRYLHEALGDLIRALMESEDDCEVDPLKIHPDTNLHKQQETMMLIVEMTWAKIMNSTRYFPADLREVFTVLRLRLTASGRPELADTIISACIFLRFLCPAILSPSLFGLVQEYPNQRNARNLTLIAKTVQTLANFAKFNGKESYMEFMNVFVERELPSMRTFLNLISTPAPMNMNGMETDCHVDLGRELASLHSLLRDNLANCAVNLKLLPEIMEDLNMQLTNSLRSPALLNESVYSTYLSREVQDQLLSRLHHMHAACRECQESTGRHSVNNRQSALHASNGSLTRNSYLMGLGSNQRPARNLSTADDYVLSSAIDVKAARGSSPHINLAISCDGRRHQEDNRKSLVKLAVNGDYVDLIGLDRGERGSQTSISQLSSGYQSSSRPKAQSCTSCSPVELKESNVRAKMNRASFIENSSLTRLSSSSDSAASSLSSGTPPRERRNYGAGIPRTNPLYPQTALAMSASNPSSPKLPVRAFGDTEKRRLKHRSSLSRKSSASPDRTRDDTEESSGRGSMQCEREIDGLRAQMEQLQLKLKDAERKLCNQEQNTEKVILEWKSQIEAGEERTRREQLEKDQQMRTIVTRLISVEEELRREQAELIGMMKAKQKVIEAQERKIESLTAANERLLATLAQMKETAISMKPWNGSATDRVNSLNSTSSRDPRNDASALGFLSTPEARELRSSSC